MTGSPVATKCPHKTGNKRADKRRKRTPCINDTISLIFMSPNAEFVAEMAIKPEVVDWVEFNVAFITIPEHIYIYSTMELMRG